MSLAAETREAVRNRPALFAALRAGVLNYTAAAESLAIEGDREAIATALRRFAADLDEPSTVGRSITIRLHSSIKAVDAEMLLAVDGTTIARSENPGDGASATTVDTQSAVRVSGDVDARLLSAVLDRLQIAEVPVAAAGVIDGSMVVVVPRREGPTAVQLIEAVVDTGY